MKQIIKKELILLEDLGMKYPKETSKEKKRYGLFRCHCGKEFKTQTRDVKSGRVSSCGCYRRYKTAETNTKNKATHGLSSHRLYGTWFAMMQRCNNKSNNSYSTYGKLGIKVCEEWNNIENFINDMLPTFIEGLTLDRIDVNGNYCNDNCRWANENTQARNKRLIQVNNTSGYKGVCLHKPSGKFQSLIRVNKKLIYLGLSKTAIEAAKKYDKNIIENNLEHTLNGVIL